MKISKLVLKNFRCFGPTPTEVSLDGLTTLVGANGSGKTALLQAITRMFSPLPSERRLTKDDFYVSVGQKVNITDSIEMYIEVYLVFPELSSGGELTNAIPPHWNHMIVEEEGGSPFCRIRLEASWRANSTDDGDIDDGLFWITTANGEPTPEDKHRVRANERRNIHALYVPATRDPAVQLKNIAGTMLARVVRSINWSQGSGEVVSNAAQQVQTAFLSEDGVKMFHEAIKANWTGLHGEAIYSIPQMSFMGNGVEEVLKQVGMVFEPSETGDKHSIDRLSDGQRSLFYLAFVATMCDIEQRVAADLGAFVGSESATGNKLPPMDWHRLAPPMLTLLAIEEPENHLAPHYLGRVMALLARIAECGAVQVVLTSHSPSILKRVDPTWVRHFRLQPDTGCAAVRKIRLPEKSDAAFKYVKEAVRAYPEIYFSRLVILGEGDSEEVVIPRIAHCNGLDIDTGFMSIVPLGGRYVGHFWRLLTDLDIPYITLLDLDLGRHGGGWGRIQGTCDELMQTGVDKQTIFGMVSSEHRPALSEEEYADMHKRDPLDETGLNDWTAKLEEFGVFFSAPLDLDLMMFQSLPEAYRSLAPAEGGPHIPDEEPQRRSRLNKAILAVLGDRGSEITYSTVTIEEFPWYSYLFHGKGKPSAHLCALSSTDDSKLKSSTPAVLYRLISRAKTELNLS